MRQQYMSLAKAVQISSALLGLTSTSLVYSSTSLEEVVVTARKKVESLQDTPIAVSAFGAGDIEARSIDNVSELGNATPNVILDQGAGASGANSATTIFIRGVGQSDYTLSVDPGVGVYVDGVYFGQQVGSSMDFLDLERVEILRGPQGTLFGRNTIGGAVSVTSKAPTDEFGLKVRATVGEYDRRDAEVSINTPISDDVLSRFSLSSRKRDGYVQRVGAGALGDEDSLSARGSLVWNANDRLSFRLNGDYTKEREEVAPEVLVNVIEGAPIPGYANFLAGPDCFGPDAESTPTCFNNQWVPDNPFLEYGTTESVSEIDVWGLSLTSTLEMDGFTIKSITAHREFESYFSTDLDHSPVTIVQFTSDFEVEQFTQELQFLGTSFDDRLDWIVGLYYYDESSWDYNPVDMSLGSLTVGGELDVTSYAAFAQATFDITDKLSVTGGLRYTDEEKERLPDSYFTSTFVLGPTFAFPEGTILVPNERASVSEDAWTPLLNLTYNWNDDVMSYVTYSEGFKGGGFTDRVSVPVAEAPTFKPEYVESFELGLKATLWDDRLRINAAAFKMDYTNIQVLVAADIAPDTRNAAEAEVQGFELELQSILVDEFQVGAGIGYMDAKYTEVDPRAVEISEDNSFPKTPEWTGNLSAWYPLAITNWGTITPRVDWYYRGDFYHNALNSEFAKEDSYALINASIRLEPHSGNWAVTLAGKNLSDEEYFVHRIQNGAQGIAAGAPGRPQEWSLRFDYEF